MFTIKGCSLIRGVHYERFHCIHIDIFSFLNQSLISLYFARKKHLFFHKVDLNIMFIFCLIQCIYNYCSL